MLLAIGSVGMSALLEHYHASRPLTTVSLFWSSMALLSVARVRTAWLIDPDAHVSAALVAFCVFLGAAMVLQLYCKPQMMTSRAPTASRESQSNFWDRVVFGWLVDTLKTGYNKVLSLEDLPMLDAKLRSERLHRDIQSTWKQPRARNRPSLIRASARQCVWSFASGIPPRLALTAFTFAQPFLVNTTVTYIGQTKADEAHGKALIGAWALVFLGLAVSNSVYSYQNARFMTRVRGSLLGLIYEHTLKTRAVDLGEITAVTVMGTDVERIYMGTRSIHLSWSAILDIGIATWLLEKQLGAACAAPIVITVLFMGIGASLSSKSNGAQRVWIEGVQDRLRVTTALLDDIKAVQMQGLSQVMKTLITELRQKEIKGSEKFRKLLTLNAALSISLLSLAPVSTFIVYAIIAIVSKQETLLSAQAFTSVSLVGLLATPVLIFIQSFPSVIQCKACFERIEQFCKYSANGTDDYGTAPDATDTLEVALNTMMPEKSKRYGLNDMSDVFALTAQSFWWDGSKDAILRDVQLRVKRGEVTAIVGAVGSGKSTLLASLLGETISRTLIMGKRALPEIAYCSQEPWLETVSVQQNIIGTASFDEKWYKTVVNSCGLCPDIATMPKGDQTVVSSKGLNLSGGQKQRIALARAVYSRRDIVLLDDVFSGMDANTVANVSQALLGKDGLLRQAGTSVVVATHNRDVMALADSVLSLEDGRVHTARTAPALSGLDDLGSRDPPLPDGVKVESMPNLDPVHNSMQPVFARPHDAGNASDSDESRRRGDLSVYSYYLKRSGYRIVALYVAVMVVGEFCTEFPTIWLKWWSEANETHPNERIGMYMGVYAAIGVVAALCSCYSIWVMAVNMISKSALALHADLLDTVIRAPFSYFTSTTTGSLTNRFGEDMELIGMALPLDMANYTSLAVSCLIKVIIMMVFGRYLGAAVPLLAMVLFVLQRFYLRTSRQIRLLGIEAKAPLYTAFLESTAGAATIRAFGWQRHYQERAYRLIDSSQQPAYYQLCLQHWLEFMLDLVVAALSVTLVAIVTTWRETFSAGSVGVALVMIVGFNLSLKQLILSWTRLESSIGAVARIKQFVAHTDVEDAHVVTTRQSKSQWDTGAIVLVDVTARYR